MMKIFKDDVRVSCVRRLLKLVKIDGCDGYDAEVEFLSSLAEEYNECSHLKEPGAPSLQHALIENGTVTEVRTIEALGILYAHIFGFNPFIVHVQNIRIYVRDGYSYVGKR